MTKQSFTIPEGCKAVTVEQDRQNIITTFDSATDKHFSPSILEELDSSKELAVVFANEIYERVVAGEKLEANDLVSIQDGKVQKIEPFIVDVLLEFNEEMQTLQVNVPDDTVIEKGIIIDGVTYP